LLEQAMSNFKYKRNQLYCEAVPLKQIAESAGTPVYIYSYQSLVGRYKELKQAFASAHPLICFSVKANSNLTICKVLSEQGAGLDIVSGGELYRAKKIKVDPQKIVFAGAGKTEEEIREAIKAKILLINAESEQEVEEIDRIAGELGRKIRVGLRINPDVPGGGHRYIQTAKEENKFGISLKEAKELFLKKEKFSHLNICGIHFHLGSQITTPQPFVRALKKIVPLIQELKKKGVEISYLDIGGGFFGVANKFARAILPLVKGLEINPVRSKSRFMGTAPAEHQGTSNGVKLILEPGRFLTAESGILLTKVLYIKKREEGKRFIIVDAGMNDFIRPALYNAYHEVIPVVRKPLNPQPSTLSDVVGPVCESGDFFAKDRNLPLLKSGDFLAVMESGAYGFVMASNYNSRPRPAEILVKEDKFYLIRERERYRDLIRGELTMEGSPP